MIRPNAGDGSCQEVSLGVYPDWEALAATAPSDDTDFAVRPMVTEDGVDAHEVLYRLYQQHKLEAAPHLGATSIMIIGLPDGSLEKVLLLNPSQSRSFG